MKDALRLAALLSSLGLGACCGDTQATLLVHAVDGENGATLADPNVSVDGETLLCGDTSFRSLPQPTDDGGTIVPPPGSDLGTVPPPNSQHFCETWEASVDPGTRTVHLSAQGYFTTDVQVDLGSEGGS